MTKNVTIIDYGVGNTLSVQAALEQLNYEVTVSSDEKDLRAADALILPGVGAFEVAIRNLKKNNLVPLLHTLVMEEKKPILGICLGMQLLATTSEENGIHEGLGWIPGTVRKFTPDPSIRVPHVGWNDVTINKTAPLFSRLNGAPNFYFDHSYHFDCADSADIAATCNYGGPIVAAVKRNNIHGVQFHPEKSQVTGLKLLRGFMNAIEEA
jgi:imidazole glycerol-phosphate synthase subunit HisH